MSQLYTILIRVEAPAVCNGSKGEGSEPSCLPLSPINSDDSWVSLKGVKRQLSCYGVGVGALDGGSPCRMSILRNGNVACLCR